MPEILPCIGCTQPGRWHCYDVWQHSAAAVAALDLRGQDTRGVRVLCWATFLHDIAKPQCRSSRPRRRGAFQGAQPAGGAGWPASILRRLKAPAYLTDGAVGLIAVHDAPLPADDAGILKLLNRSGAIFLRRLCVLKYADLDAHAAYTGGRGPPCRGCNALPAAWTSLPRPAATQCVSWPSTAPT